MNDFYIVALVVPTALTGICLFVIAVAFLVAVVKNLYKKDTDGEKEVINEVVTFMTVCVFVITLVLIVGGMGRLVWISETYRPPVENNLPISLDEEVVILDKSYGGVKTIRHLIVEKKGAKKFDMKVIFPYPPEVTVKERLY